MTHADGETSPQNPEWEGETIEIQELLELLPHRYPFLLVDRIVAVKGDNSAIGIKNVTINEPFFQGHFPGQPVMPGVLLLEGMAQTAGAICMHAFRESYTTTVVYFMTVDKARFRRPVLPGHQLHYHVEKIRNRGRVWRFRCEAKVDGQLVAEAVISAMVPDPEEKEAGA